MRNSLVLVVSILATVALAQPAPDGGFDGGPHRRRPGRRGPEGDMSKAPWVLRLAIRKADKQRYTGKRTIEFRRGPNTLRHEEFVTRDGRRSRIEFPGASPFTGQIIVEDGKERRHFFPDRNEIRVLPPRREEAMERLSRLIPPPGGPEFFKLRQEPGETIAGYRTEQVIVTDGFGNVMQRLYIEPKSGVVLKRRLFDRVGTQFGYFAFTQVDLNPPAFNGSTFKIERRGATVVTPEVLLKRLCKANGFKPLRLPDSSGYRLEAVDVMHIAGRTVLAQLYSSGHQKLSFFQVIGAVDEGKLAWAKKDFKVHSWEKDGHGYVLMANLDESELERLGRMAR